MADQKAWWVYILQSERTGVTYTGMTADFDRRLRQHNGELLGGARSTRSGRPWKLIHMEGPLGRVEAHRREYAIKQLPRDTKLALAMAGRSDRPRTR